MNGFKKITEILYIKLIYEIRKYKSLMWYQDTYKLKKINDIKIIYVENAGMSNNFMNVKFRPKS